MKRAGFIQPIPETQELWDQLAAAKAARDIKEIGRLSAEIRTVTIRAGK